MYKGPDQSNSSFPLAPPVLARGAFDASRISATAALETTSLAGNAAIESPVPVPLDLAELRRRCMGRLDFADRLLASFDTRFPVEVLEIVQSLDAEDMPRLARLVHQLKGTTANICAPILNQIVQRIEETVKAGELAETRRELEQLEHEWERFTEFKESMGGAVTN
jgi:HPt (histidine-containing phosphotransfer) domain-containing protein